ncbi:MAG: hypothetical protein RL681_611 [Candidatus Parcubacteria bacterium]
MEAVAKTAVPTEELRRHFVNVSQRIGLLLVRYKRFAEGPPAAAKREELSDELEAEYQGLEYELQLLWDRKFRRGQLMLFREVLEAAATAAKERMDALKKSEGA